MAKKQKSQRDLKTYAPLGLWLAGAAALATLILLFVKFLAAEGVYTPPDEKRFNLVIWIAAGLILIGLAVYAILDPQRTREFLFGRRARYGGNAAVTLLAWLGVLIVVNAIAVQYPQQWDLTEEKKFTLAKETEETLDKLTEPVHAIAFYTAQSSPQSARELLENYKRRSNGRFDYEFQDPDQNPVLAQQLGITGDGKIYLEMGDRHEIVSYASEQEITRALVRLMNPGERTVYFLSGHGERDIEGYGNDGYSKLSSTLEAKNYTVKKLPLLAEGKIPEDALAIIIAGPRQPVSQEEVNMLIDYLAKGGSLVVMEDPVPLTDFGDAPDPLANYLVTAWGIRLNNDIVVDTNSSQPLVPFGVDYSTHSITQKLRGVVSFYPEARSITLVENPPHAVDSLVRTLNRAWGETDFTALKSGQASPDQESDVIGPITLAASSEDTNSGARLVVFGDSDFASNAYFDQYANGDVIVNAIDWAAEQEGLINLTPKQSIYRQLKPVSNVTLTLVAILSICIIPLLVIGGGVASWLARRMRG